MLLRVALKSESRGTVDDVVSLDYQRRRLSRQRVSTEQGRDLAITLPRGTVLEHGDCLIADDGTRIGVIATDEPLSRVECKTAEGQARVAYHLGNRHVPVEIGEGYVAYLQDHVLDALIQKIGYTVSHALARFQPVPGAYVGIDWGGPADIRVCSTVENVTPPTAKIRAGKVDSTTMAGRTENRNGPVGNH